MEANQKEGKQWCKDYMLCGTSKKIRTKEECTVTEVGILFGFGVNLCSTP